MGWRGRSGGRGVMGGGRWRGERRVALAAGLLLLAAGTHGGCEDKLPGCDKDTHCGVKGRGDRKCKNKGNGNHCSAQCDNGYYAANTWTGKATCGGGYRQLCYVCSTDKHGNRQWMRSPYTGGQNGDTSGPDCQPVPCAAHSPVPNANLCQAGHFDGPTCGPLDCDPGYTRSGDDDDATFTCSASGHWTGGDMECLPVENFCPLPSEAIEGKKPRDPESCSTTVGSVCAVDCADGYEQVGGEHSYKCSPKDDGGGGEWVPVLEGEELQCERRCPAEADGVPVEGSQFPVGCDRDPSKHSPCTARCDEGYTKAAGTQFWVGSQADAFPSMAAAMPSPSSSSMGGATGLSANALQQWHDAQQQELARLFQESQKMQQALTAQHQQADASAHWDP
eukprot:COSAG02_NODE_13883_length_1335_cov_1.839806_1_plen_391_part_01